MPTTNSPSSPSSSRRPSSSSHLVWVAAALSLPSSPGVYWFLDAQNNVLYVGKAKNLKNRVSAYRHPLELSARIRQMVETATQFKFQVLESELEALLVEAELIRTHQPPYNILLKDDKTPLYIVVTTGELFPRVITARKKEIDKKLLHGTVLGPFQSSYRVREVLKIARAIFKWCSQPLNDKAFQQLPTISTKPCFYHHLDLCSGACVGEITPIDYQQSMSDLIEFLRGKKKTVLKNMTDHMQQAVENLDYERAALIRDKIQLIKVVTQKTYSLKPDTVLPKLLADVSQEKIVYLRKILSTYLSLPKNYPLDRIECYDVSNTQGTNASVAMVTFMHGQSDPSQYRLFNIRLLDTPNDFAMHQEALLRRQNHPEWGRPNLIIIDGGKGQVRAVLQIWQWDIPVIGIAKNPDRLIIPIIKKKPQLHTPTQPATPTLNLAPEYDTHRRLSLDYHVVKLPENHPALTLVQQLRDEAHRFSKKQHTSRRLKNMFS